MTLRHYSGVVEVQNTRIKDFHACGQVLPQGLRKLRRIKFKKSPIYSQLPKVLPDKAHERRVLKKGMKRDGRTEKPRAERGSKNATTANSPERLRKR